MTIGQKIKQLRVAQGLKQQELADKIGVAGCTIWHWEKDDNEPHLYALLGMAEIFNVTLDELCCRRTKKGDNNG